ncbi:hypothetical protein [Clostridium sp. HBUAS56010]|uniref:hypothetical protein n=1 Tax=Clostridium sp. HBUAS56010 TaxID=2571127 RepID=UPI0011776090|nr:hypothetical protein [Clostridium sp. HBUAS56010]
MSIYVCQLPQAIQDEIIKKCTEVFESLVFPVDIEEEIQNVLCSKLSDISDTIDIQPYLNIMP